MTTGQPTLLVPARLRVGTSFAYVHGGRPPWGGQLIQIGNNGGWLLLERGGTYYFVIAGRDFNYGSVFLEVDTGTDLKTPPTRLAQQHLNEVLRSFSVKMTEHRGKFLLLEQCDEHDSSFVVHQPKENDCIVIGHRMVYFVPLELEPLISALLEQCKSQCTH